MKGKGSGRGKALLILILILLLGAMLRFYRLGEKSLWLDEASILHVSSHVPLKLIEQVRRTEAHPPLYPLLLNLWSRPPAPLAVEGGGPMIYFPRPRTPSEFRIRSLSVLAGLALIAIIFLQSGQSPRRQRYIAALLVASSAYQVYYSQEARLHCLVALLSLLSVYALGRATRTNRPVAWGAFVIVTSLALYTYYYVFFLVLAEAIFLGILVWGKKKRQLLRPFLFCLLVILILFLPWTSVLKERIALASRVRPPESRASQLYLDAGRSLCQYLLGPFSQPTNPRLGPALGLIVLVTANALRTSPRKEICLLYLLWLLVPILGVIYLPLKLHSLESKHLIFVSPALYLLFSEGVICLPRKELAVAVVAVVLALNLLALPPYYSPDHVKEDWRQVAGSVEEKAEAGDLVLFDPGYLGFPFDYYYRGSARRLAMPPAHQIPLGPATRQIVVNLRQHHERIWLISAKSSVAHPRPDTIQAIGDHYQESERRVYRGEKGRIEVRLYQAIRAPEATSPASDN